ncbi:MAG: UDP-N-acetylmuramoyl-L-alanine--D-glutamate ligase [Cyclobacteriaceae bacterium]|nr:UDP-N-acetylmuramoyl-L-alanine--D-glutamate ligase [Cyclobacteriaceae bacterium]
MNKRIVILGAGESGTGAALLAKAKGYDVFVSDIGTIQPKYIQQLKDLGIDYEQGQHTEKKIYETSTIIKSPGIPESAKILQGAIRRGISVIDEIEFASRYTNARIIAITGTNGKTTTTLLIYHLLKQAGFNVGLAGNVGESLAKQMIKDDKDYFVIEISSFQIDGIDTFSPEVAVLLNITPDHLNRYDNDFKKYINSKFRLIENLKSNSSFIYFNDDENIKYKIESETYKGVKHPITLSEDTTQSARVIGDEMLFNINQQVIQIKQRETTLKGRHNLINTMAAVLAAFKVGVSEKDIRSGLKTFKNAPHRLEYVATIKDVDFYNDSKATNVEATKYALESFNDSLVWIAGGIDKGNDYQQIMKLVNNKVKTLVCLGKDNKKLRNAFHDQIVNMLETDNMKQAIDSAMNSAKANDVVLLSPACASFDLFNNYEDRGNQFKEAVLNLKNTYSN